MLRARGRLIGPLFGVFILSLGAATAQGASYYVNDAAVTNDQWCLQAADGAGNGTTADPWTIAEFASWVEGAGTQLNPGDTVFIDSGTYDNDNTNGILISTTDDGTSGSPVTIRGALLGATRLTTVHDTAGTARERLWHFTGQYVVLQDMILHTARNAGGGGFGDGYGIFAEGTTCTNITMRNLEIYNCEESAILCYDAATPYLAGHIIEDCDIYANNTASSTGALRIRRARGVTVRRTRVHRNSSLGVWVDINSSTAAEPFTLEDCRVYSNVSTSPGVWIYGTNTDVVVRRCFLYATSQLLRFGDGVNFTSNNGQVLNCVLYTTTTSADSWALLFANGSNNFTVKNNIVYVSGADIRGIYLPNDEAGVCNYNCVYTASGAWAGDTNSTLPGLSFSGWQATGRDANGVNKDPRFVDVDGTDATLGDPGGAPDEGLDDDVHESSTFGYYTNAGGPFYDRNYDSACVDGGDPADAVGSETANHGSRINMGIYGGLAQAARSGDAAYDKTWTGGSVLYDDPTAYNQSANWDNGNNWSGRTVPSSSQTVLIPNRTGVDQDPSAATETPLQPSTNASATVSSIYVGDTANVYPNPGTAPTVGLLNVDTAATALTASAISATAIRIDGLGRVDVSIGTLDASGGGIQVDSGGVLDISGGTVRANSGYSLANGGTVRCTAAAGNGAIDSVFSNNSGGTLSITDGQIQFQRNFTNAVGATISISAGESIAFSGGADQTLTLTAAATFQNLTVDKTAGTLSLAGGTVLTVAGNLTVQGSGTLDCGNGATHSVTGTTTVSGGTLRLDQGILRSSGAATVSGGAADLSGGGAWELDGANPALSVTGSGTLRASGTGGNPILRRSSGANTLTLFIDGTLDANGLTLEDLGPLSGGREGFEIGPNATIASLSDAIIQSNVRGIFVNRAAAPAWTFRSLQFVTSTPTSTYNLRIPSSTTLDLTVENPSGAGGQDDAISGNGIGGEENDQDPDDGDPLSDSSQGRIKWVYFAWKWLGGAGTNLWDEPVQANDLANWQWQGLGPRPSDFPDATDADVWIQGANPCNQNGSFNVRGLSVASGSTLNQSGAAVTLSIWGTAFKSAGGTFSSGPDEDWVEFRGSDTQTILIIGGSGAFRNLRSNKTGGTTASLGTSLSVNNQLEVTGGTLDLADYTLTVTGTANVSAALRNAGSSRWVQTGVATISGTYTMVGPATSEFGAVAHTVTGTVELNDAASLRVSDGGTFSFGAGSTFRSNGTSPTVTILGSRVAGFGWNLNTGSTIDVARLNFSYGNASGFNVASGVTLVKLQRVNFTNALSGGRHLSLNGAYTATLTNCTFDSTYTPGSGYNVWTGATASGTITLSMYGGTGAGDTVGGFNADFDNPESAPGTMAVNWAPSRVWDGKWRFRQNVRIVTGAGGALPNGFSVQVVVNTTGANFVNASGNDIRVFHVPTGTELDRQVIGPKTASTEVWFKLQAAIGASTTNLDYFIYYGASDSYSAGPPADLNDVYIYGSSFEAADGWTQSGAISTWARGNPVSGPNAARTGTNVWATSLAGDYVINECSYLQSPFLDFSTAGTKRIEFYMWREFEPAATGKYFDGAVIDQFTGGSWARVVPSAPEVYDGALAAGAG